MPVDADDMIYSNLDSLVRLKYKANGFSFLPKQPVHSILSGRHSSRLRGRGLNFEELRFYRPGDDIRTMDWKVTNRTKKPHVRVYTEERERPVLVLVDQRINMFFGSQVKMKSVIAAECAALAAWRVLSVGDRIGAVVFNDQEIQEIKPQRSERNATHILRKVVALNHQLSADYPHANNKDQLNQALRHAERLAGHDYLIILVSDMVGWNTETLKRMKRLAQHNDLITGLVADPVEYNPPERGKYIISDGQMQIQVDAAQQQLSSQIKQRFEKKMEHISHELKKHGVPVIPLNTLEDVPMQLRNAIGSARGR